MQSTILASVNGRLGVGGWREHSTALCHWAETSTQEAETIQVAAWGLRPRTREREGADVIKGQTEPLSKQLLPCSRVEFI